MRVGGYGFDPRYDAFTVRGIDLTYTGVFRDGLRQLNSPNGLFRLEPYGARSDLDPARPGCVDLRRQQHRRHRRSDLEAADAPRHSARSRCRRVRSAASRAISISRARSIRTRRVFYRLTGLMRDAAAEIRAVKDDRVYIAPGHHVPADCGHQADAARRIHGFDDRRHREPTTTPMRRSRMGRATSSSAPSARRASLPATAVTTTSASSRARIGYEFEHRFSEVFKLHQNLRYSQLKTNQQYAFGGAPGLVREEQCRHRRRYLSRKPVADRSARAPHSDRHRREPPDLYVEGGLRRRADRRRSGARRPHRPDADAHRRLCPGPDQVGPLATACRRPLRLAVE